MSIESEKFNNSESSESSDEKKRKNGEVLSHLIKESAAPLTNKEHPSLDFMTATTSFTRELLKKITGHDFTSYGERASGNESRDLIDSKLKDFFLDTISGELVLDLGAGVQGTGYAISNESKADGYIGVEMNFAEVLNRRLNTMKGDIPFVILQDDFCAVLEKMIEDAEKVKVVIYSGIDVASYTGEAPLEEIWQSIHDVLQEKGVLLLGGNLGFYGEEYGPVKDLTKLFEPINIYHLPETVRLYRKKT